VELRDRSDPQSHPARYCDQSARSVSSEASYALLSSLSAGRRAHVSVLALLGWAGLFAAFAFSRLLLFRCVGDH